MDTLQIFPKWGCDVVTIYDTIPEIFEKDFRAIYSDKMYRKKANQKANAYNKAKLVLTDSECAKHDLERIFNGKKQIKVIPCSWEHILRIQEDNEVLDKLNLKPKEYFFSLGSRFPHKNVKWISSAASSNPTYTFVVSGSTPRVDYIDDEGNCRDNMIFTGYLTDGEVKCLMKNCIAFIQPSLYEGFGIPPMEAMGVGTDCIVSNRSSLPEVYGGSVWYIDPDNYESIDIKSIMSIKKESNTVVLEKYSWGKSAKMLLQAIEDQF